MQQHTKKTALNSLSALADFCGTRGWSGCQTTKAPPNLGSTNSKILCVQARLWHSMARWSPFTTNLHFICSRLDAGKTGIQSGCPTNLSALAGQLTRGLKIWKLGLSPISLTCRGQHGLHPLAKSVKLGALCHDFKCYLVSRWNAEDSPVLVKQVTPKLQ